MVLSQFVVSAFPDVNRRGLDYYYASRIASFSEYRPGWWVAEVEGTDTYQLEIHLDQQTVTQYACSCPYDQGPVCKHLIALGHAILEEQQRRDFAEKHRVDQKMLSEPSFHELVQEKMARWGPKGLAAFVSEYGRHNAAFRRAFQNWDAKTSEEADA